MRLVLQIPPQGNWIIYHTTSSAKAFATYPHYTKLQFYRFLPKEFEKSITHHPRRHLPLIYIIQNCTVAQIIFEEFPGSSRNSPHSVCCSHQLSSELLQGKDHVITQWRKAYRLSKMIVVHNSRHTTKGPIQNTSSKLQPQKETTRQKNTTWR